MGVVLLLVMMGAAPAPQNTDEVRTSERAWFNELILPDRLEIRRRVLETPHDLFRFVSIPFSRIVCEQ